jgi:hypothetical protein
VSERETERGERERETVSERERERESERLFHWQEDIEYQICSITS